MSDLSEMDSLSIHTNSQDPNLESLLAKPTLLENLVGMLDERYTDNVRWKEAWGKIVWGPIMQKTTNHIEKILNSSPLLTREVLTKIYTQWHELCELEFDYIDLLKGGIRWFREFNDATVSILNLPIDVNNTGDFIYMVQFIDTLKKEQWDSGMVDEDEIIALFKKSLPTIPQATIDTARDIWKKEMKSGVRDIESDYPDDFFKNTDPGGYYPDLDYLMFFAERGSEDEEIKKWAERFRAYYNWIKRIKTNMDDNNTLY